MNKLNQLIFLTFLFIMTVSLVSSRDRYFTSAELAEASTQDGVDYLIITSESLLDEIQPLAIWKQQRGLSTAIVTVEKIYEEYSGRDQAEAVRNCIKDFHKQLGTKWILFAGDQSHVPVRWVNVSGYPVICDQYYTILDNNWVWNNNETVSAINSFDWDTDIYIGRLSAENAVQMAELVYRQLNYEKTPLVGSWMTNALFAGAYANFDVIIGDQVATAFDANRVHNWMKNNVLPSNWNSTILGEKEGLEPSEYYYDEPLNEPNLVQAINKGSSIAMFDAHGTTTGMTRLVFTKDNNNDSIFEWGIDERSSYPLINIDSIIDTGGKDAFFFLSACNTGNFESSGDCLAEHILHNGGIGVIASSYSANYENDWYERDHGGWYSQGLSTRFWKQFLIKGVNQPGKAFIEAKIDYIQDYISLNGKEEDRNRTLFQYNLLGDPEIPVWTKIPLKLLSEIIGESNNQLTLLSKAEEQIIPEVVVTLSNSTHYWKNLTNSEGELTLPISQIELNNLTLTLSKNNFLPYQETSETEFTSFNYPLPRSKQISSFSILSLISSFVIFIYIIRSKMKK